MQSKVWRLESRFSQIASIVFTFRVIFCLAFREPIIFTIFHDASILAFSVAFCSPHLATFHILRWFHINFEGATHVVTWRRGLKRLLAPFDFDTNFWWTIPSSLLALITSAFGNPRQTKLSHFCQHTILLVPCGELYHRPYWPL